MLYGYLFFVILTRPLRVGAKVYSEEQATETRAEEKSVEQALSSPTAPSLDNIYM